MTEGIILKGVGGFYYVDTPTGLVECKARGRFRKTVGKPIVGDRVSLEIQAEDGTGYLLDIAPRKNSLIRPAVANLDLLVVVASAAQPVTDPFLIDKVTAIAVHKGIDALVVINKTDADAGDALAAIYAQSGFETLRVSAQTGAGIDALRARIRGLVSAFAGNSGVGKSSILNRLDPQFGAAVGAISDRIGRGRHTTRHVELHPIAGGGYIADTPGFSSFETGQMDLVRADALEHAFPEFAPYLGQCRFTGCAHVKELGCAVRAAVAAGAIAPSRHESYVKLYESVKDLKEWEITKGGTR
ncbi:MAG: ribosome small subunit-dependent GTPase A [Eubacteriales bacterium]|nr:ribosome small subunit-dependent GTPase A [Eubacteriales bacterium]